MSSNSKLIFDSYCILTSASPLYQQCWMCDETIVRILNSHYPHLKKGFNISRTGLNRVLSAKAGPCTVQNPHAIYVAQFKTDCPYSGDRRKVFYYFRQDTNNNEPKMIQCLFQMLLINLLCQISCRETASVFAVTCPMCVWSWGGKGEEGGEEGGDGERGGEIGRAHV